MKFSGPHCSLVSLLLAAVAQAAEPGRAEPPHAVAPTPSAGRAMDLQGFIDGQLKAGKKRVVVAPGRYRVKPSQGQHLRFQDLAEVEIIADGV